MNLLPPLTEDERGRLRASILQDGVIIPVLQDAQGNVIDGHHRHLIATELGVDYPVQTIDVDAETADRLRLTLNWARRQLDTLTGYELIAELAKRHEAAARAEAKKRQREHGGTAPGRTLEEAASSSVREPQSREVIADLINTDLKALGETKRISGKGVDTARKAAALPTETKTRIRSGETSVSRVLGVQGKATRKGPVNNGSARARPGYAEELGQAARIRAIDAELQYQSMFNAPANKLNLPLIRRAEKVMEMLTELIGLDPAKAVSQLPIERCREFTVAHAAWWSEFTALCEERRAAETPDLPPRPYRPRNAVLNPVVLGTIHLAAEERHLTPGERAVLDWIRAQDEPVTVVEIAVGIRNRSKESTELRVRKLVASNLVELAGKVGRQSAYRAVNRIP